MKYFINMISLGFLICAVGKFLYSICSISFPERERKVFAVIKEQMSYIPESRKKEL